jgi:hypothetical protein
MRAWEETCKFARALKNEEGDFRTPIGEILPELALLRFRAPDRRKEKGWHLSSFR